MAIELDRIGQLGIVAEINAESPSVDRLDVPHSRIEDQQLRVSLRVGEMITSVASGGGVVLDIPSAPAGDDWILLNEETAMGALRRHGRQTVNRVLKAVRNSANRSDLNGDREAVLGRISALLKTENRPLVSKFEPPCVIPRTH